MRAHTTSKSNKYQPGTAVSASTRRIAELEQVDENLSNNKTITPFFIYFVFVDSSQ